MRALDFKKYALVFVITAAIFGTALYISNLLSNRRIAEIQAIEDKISIDILSSETQYALLSESSCVNLAGSVLSQEINSLAERLSYMENSLGVDNPEVVRLKRYYSLLQIKDYLLMKKVNSQCGIKSVTMLYFYSNRGDCEDCTKIGYILTYLREKYPKLRVYAFDANLDLSAIKTLRALYSVKDVLPVITIDQKVFYGFQDKETIEKELLKIKGFDKTTATTTQVNE
ncbi:MAG: hypothetical protein Q7R98_01845 [Candidatus Jorgensenbacteria bacterium]|nr:hypothetical protein [Candidatus Jorgensenbacteria bacterium]